MVFFIFWKWMLLKTKIDLQGLKKHLPKNKLIALLS